MLNLHVLNASEVHSAHNTSYWKSVVDAVTTTWKGLKITLLHLKKRGNKRAISDIKNDAYFQESTGAITVEYPYESLPVPDHGRYRLHNEIEDCIVCDKCAKICPVDCIEIEAIKAEGEVRKTSDGSTVRLYAAKFDIDMAKCCFCGLCTTVCPTECLTMTPSYDFSEFDVRDMVYQYSDLDLVQIAQLRAEEEKRAEAKQAAKAIQNQTATNQETSKPAFKPVLKPKLPPLDPS